MKILKLLNNKNLSIIIVSLLLSISSIAEEKPVDIWNLDKKETQNISEENLSVEQNEETSQTDIYNCLLYTSPSPRDGLLSRMPSSA